MRDTLTNDIFEKLAVNLDSILGSGIHWVYYVKRKSKTKYFYRFGI